MVIGWRVEVCAIHLEFVAYCIFHCTPWTNDGSVGIGDCLNVLWERGIVSACHEWNSAIVRLRDILHGFVEEISAIFVGIEESGGRCWAVSERGVARCAWEQVGDTFSELSARPDNGVSLMIDICIDCIIIPGIFVIVDMCYQKSMGIKWAAPFGQLAVFEQIILVGVALVV